MGDGREGPDVQSLAHTLVCWFGEEAQRQGVVAKGENALNFTLNDAGAWDLIRSVLHPSESGLYFGLTILRISDVLGGVAGNKLDELMEFMEQSYSLSADPVSITADAVVDNTGVVGALKSAFSGAVSLLENIGSDVANAGGALPAPRPAM